MICPHCGGDTTQAVRRRPLTPTQREHLLYVSMTISETGCAPSFAEFAEVFGFSSLATVHEALGRLEQKGWLRREFNEARAITMLVSHEVIMDMVA